MDPQQIVISLTLFKVMTGVAIGAGILLFFNVAFLVNVVVYRYRTARAVQALVEHERVEALTASARMSRLFDDGIQNMRRQL